MRTVEEIYSELAAEFARRTGQEAGQSGEMTARLYAVAAQVYALEAQNEWTARQCFPQTAAGEHLDMHATLRGMARREAGRAQGVLRFSVDRAATTDLSIPVGTVCMTVDQMRFETTEEGKIPAGSTWGEVCARAVEPGRNGNVGSGTVLSMAVAPVGVSRCGNPAPFGGGTDREGDEELRQRVLETFKRLPNGANAAFYEMGAMRFPEVAAAAVLPRRRGIGTVDVAVATAAGMPDAPLLEQIRDYYRERREIAVDVAVMAPEAKQVRVAVGIAPAEGQDFQAVKARVEGVVAAWFGGGRLGKGVLRAELGQIIFGVEGVANYVITEPAADVPAVADQLPRLENLTVTRLEGST